MIYALDFSHWKRKPLKLCFPGHSIRFISHINQVPNGAVMAVWGTRPVPGASERDILVVRIEDGFLRSIGLGADLTRPVSWVVDWRGMHFDATQASDLEELLAKMTFSKELLQRAVALRERIVANGLTKYNVGVAAWTRPSDGRRVILVPGQVESDASLAFGAPGVKTNIGLLQEVRKANPDAYVLYKPHPDVVAGLRAQGKAEDSATSWCDELVIDASMGSLLTQVNEVHVMTSLAGFEALLRGKRVVCYGQPFYAGWGLTIDILPLARRIRRLSLDELVAGALMIYPRYMSLRADRLISPETALDELMAWRAASGSKPPWWRQWIRVVLRQVVGVR